MPGTDGPTPNHPPETGQLRKRQRPEIAADFYALILADLEKYKGNLDRLADGVFVEDDRGRIYTTPPDRQANIYLIDRVLGRPTERVESKNELTHNTNVSPESLQQGGEILKKLGLARADNPVLPTPTDTAPGRVLTDG
jgi:hypothetical protein